MEMRNPRLQAAMEYLTTYGWAILIIALVAIALFYLRVFNPSTSSDCILTAGITCSNLYMTTNGLLSVTLVQNTQTPINITAIGCNTNTTISNTIMTLPNNPPSNQFTVNIGGNYTMALQCYSAGKAFSGPVGNSYSGYLLVNYTQQYSALPHTIYGNLNVRVS